MFSGLKKGASSSSLFWGQEKKGQKTVSSIARDQELVHLILISQVGTACFKGGVKGRGSLELAKLKAAFVIRTLTRRWERSQANRSSRSIPYECPTFINPPIQRHPCPGNVPSAAALKFAARSLWVVRGAVPLLERAARRAFSLIWAFGLLSGKKGCRHPRRAKAP